MSRDPIDVLVTVDQSYVSPVRTLVFSLHANNPNDSFRINLIHRAIPECDLGVLRNDFARINCELVVLRVDDALFAEAPTSTRYPQEMYYRLVAAHLLPDTYDRVLYLDPDVLVINSVRTLVDIDLQGNAFAAAAHTQKTEFTHQIHQVRLNTENRYFNSGVLLMDLSRVRSCVDVEALFRYVSRRGDALILPDQDVFNALYGATTLEVDDAVWNYDARNFDTYLLRSAGKTTIDWIMKNTAIIHFCGRSKPWNERYRYRFGILYKHYRSRAEQVFDGRC